MGGCACYTHDNGLWHRTVRRVPKALSPRVVYTYTVAQKGYGTSAINFCRGTSGVPELLPLGCTRGHMKVINKY